MSVGREEAPEWGELSVEHAGEMCINNLKQTIIITKFIDLLCAGHHSTALCRVT